jgi:hypothetical protein
VTDQQEQEQPGRCVVCRGRVTGSQSCRDCTASVAQHLTDITRWYRDAQDAVGRRLGSFAPGSGSRGAADGRPLPGGDLLALTGPGSPGYSETGETDKPGDPRPIVYEICWWEQRFRSYFGETPSPRVDMRILVRLYELTKVLEQLTLDVEVLRRSSRSVAAAQASATRWAVSVELQRPQFRPGEIEFSNATRYLQQRHADAARSHPGFAQYAEDLATLHTLLAAATGNLRRPRRLPADCLDECGVQLVVEIDERTGLEKTRTILDGQTKTRVEEPSCPACHRRYSPQEYQLARSLTVRRGSTWTDDDGHEWATPETVATMLTIPARTVRTWKGRGRVRSTTLGGRLFVSTADATEQLDLMRAREQQTG